MPFLLPNQQYQSIEGNFRYSKSLAINLIRIASSVIILK